MVEATGTVTKATTRLIVGEGRCIGIIPGYTVGKVFPIHTVTKDSMEKESSERTLTKDTGLENTRTNPPAEDTPIDIMTKNTGIIMATATNPGVTKGLTFLGVNR